MLLVLIFTAPALAELLIALNTPVVAVVYEKRIVLLLMLIVLPERAVPPIPLSIAISPEVVAPERTVTVLLLIVAAALVPAWANIPLSVVAWFTPLPLLLSTVLYEIFTLHWLFARIPEAGLVVAPPP